MYDSRVERLGLQRLAGVGAIVARIKLEEGENCLNVTYDDGGRLVPFPADDDPSCFTVYVNPEMKRIVFESQAKNGSISRVVYSEEEIKNLPTTPLVPKGY